MEITNDLAFDAVKEQYCPQCYFDDDKSVLVSDCPGHTEEDE